MINVSWDDAQHYVAWLSQVTGKTYRLLSEAEYEYATRAGTTTAYPWGDDIGKNNANCDGCGSQWDNSKRRRSAPLPAKQFGLYDMVGNVWEWTEDCGHDNYNGAPTDGSAWLAANAGDCTQRIVRGGSWLFTPDNLRSAFRNAYATVYRYDYVGFRVVRTLLGPTSIGPPPTRAAPTPPAAPAPAAATQQAAALRCRRRRNARSRRGYVSGMH